MDKGRVVPIETATGKARRNKAATSYSVGRGVIQSVVKLDDHRQPTILKFGGGLSEAEVEQIAGRLPNYDYTKPLDNDKGSESETSRQRKLRNAVNDEYMIGCAVKETDIEHPVRDEIMKFIGKHGVEVTRQAVMIGQGLTETELGIAVARSKQLLRETDNLYEAGNIDGQA